MVSYGWLRFGGVASLGRGSEGTSKEVPGDVPFIESPNRYDDR